MHDIPRPSSVLTDIDTTIQQVEDLARGLRADPDGHVRRSATELRDIFSARGNVERAFTRVQASIRMLRQGDRDGTRRECRRRSDGIGRLEAVVTADLLPRLRRIGFEL